VNRNLAPDSKLDVDALYEALRKAEERATAGRLALEIMHEIRSPLEAVSNLAYLTSLDAGDPERVRQYMRLAEEQLAQVNQIASQTLDYVRAAPLSQEIDLVGVAEAALRIHRNTVQKKRIHLVKGFPDQLLGEVRTGEMLQVLSNLISNALDAMPAEGCLCLRLKKRHGKVEIVVADNGHGIPRESYREIFQPFYTTKGRHGTGLGLAISKNIIRDTAASCRSAAAFAPETVAQHSRFHYRHRKSSDRVLMISAPVPSCLPFEPW
jgi:signal transduction histidine kinase